MHGMFKNCNKLSTINSLKGWNVRNVTDTSYMFENCNKLNNLTDLKGWNTEKLQYMTAMFRDCTYINDLDALKDWNMTHVRDMQQLFENCINLEDNNAIYNWDLTQVNINKIFNDCIKLQNNSQNDDNQETEKFYPTETIESTEVFEDNPTTRLNNVDTNRFFDFYYSQDLKYVMKILEEEAKR
jgi:surface protein